MNNRRQFLRLALTATLLSAVACNSSDTMEIADLSVPLPDRVPQWNDSFQEAPCPAGLPRGAVVQCGWLTVPQDPGKENGTAIQLAVTRYISSNPDAAPDPVVYLEGGPGGSGIQTVAALFDAFYQLLQDRDLITLDQRGTGLSIPGLYCNDAGIVQPEDTDAATQLARCRQVLVNQGVDPAMYNSAANAADIEALRLALGYEQWNLLGISYGTRLALTVMRDYPEGLRSVILDSTVPVELNLYLPIGQQAQRAFEELFGACAADSTCNDRYPDLMNTFLSVLDDLDAAPPEVEVPWGRMALTGTAVLETMFSIMYHGPSLVYVPLLVSQIASGDYSAIVDVYSQLAEADADFPIGMFLSVNCAEEAAFLTEEAYFDYSDNLIPRFRDHFAPAEILSYCDAWNVPAAKSIETMPVTGDIPTLILAGHFDPITPPSNGQMVHEQLSRSQFFTFADGSHGVSVEPCGLSVSSGFFRAPDKKVPTTCIDGLAIGPFYATRTSTATPFALPGDPLPDPAQLISPFAPMNRSPSGWNQ